ncbi:MAG: hypothetical protein LBJ93_02030 [Clostridiales bacterium]|jgi:hypothetical protein|nr:hypothetical protein [Clostridiales bacterium]
MDKIKNVNLLHLIPGLTKGELLERMITIFQIFGVSLKTKEGEKCINEFLFKYRSIFLTHSGIEFLETREYKNESLFGEMTPLLSDLRPFFLKIVEKNPQSLEEVMQLIEIHINEKKIFELDTKLLIFFSEFFKCDISVLENLEIKKFCRYFQRLCSQFIIYSQNIPNKLQAFILFLHDSPEYLCLFLDIVKLDLIRREFGRFVQTRAFDATQGGIFLILIIVNFFDALPSEDRSQVFDCVVRCIEYSHSGLPIENPEVIIDFMTKQFILDTENLGRTLMGHRQMVERTLVGPRQMISSLVVIGFIQQNREKYIRQEVMTYTKSILAVNSILLISQVLEHGIENLRKGYIPSHGRIFFWLHYTEASLEEAKLATGILAKIFPFLLENIIKLNEIIEQHHRFKAFLPETLSMSVKAGWSFLVENSLVFTSSLYSEMYRAHEFFGREVFNNFCLFIAASTVDKHKKYNDIEVSSLRDHYVERYSPR